MREDCKKGLRLSDKHPQLTRLAEKLAETHHRQQEFLRRHSAADPIHPSWQQGAFSNVFGILGPRGAGKSTLLSSFYQHRGQLGEEIPSLSRFLITPPLDCSTVLDGVEPGMAILLHAFPDLDSAVGKRLREIIALYVKITDAYRDLQVDLASSPQAFSVSLVQDVRDRLGLAESLRRWLADALKEAQREAIVMLLDDFDLIAAIPVRNWFRCLLDDLHQANLYFVLTGDYYRLEYLIIDPDIQVDEKTGRAQLEKLLPWQHRIILDPWAPSEQKGFVAAALGSASEPALEDLLSEKVDRRMPIKVLFELLPTRPRGLVNLYESLSDSSSNFARSTGKIRDFLTLLAACRSEPLLARRLQESDLDDWESLFLLPGTDLSLEDWRETVKAARQRSSADPEPLKPLRGFYPLTTSSSDLRARSYSASFLASDKPVGSPGPLVGHGSEAEPLRDAEASAQPFWVELLINLSLVLNREEDHERPLRNRIRFLDSWAPTQERSKGAEIKVVLAYRQIRNFFQDYGDSGLDLGSLIYWIQWTEHADALRVDAQIGWPVLLQSLRQRRPSLAPEQVSILHLDVRQIWQERQSTPPEVLGAVPDELWAIILLIDALDRCPWATFSAKSGWHLPTYFALVGALVHGAYVYALFTAGLLPRDALSPSQQEMCEVLRKRHPGYILGRTPEEQYEDNVFARLHAVLESPLPDGPDNSLRRAAKCFFELEPYRALVHLVDEGLLF